MKPLLFISAMALATLTQAQTTDSVDNIVFKIPKNWQADKQSAYTMLTSFSKDRFCQVAFYQKQAATADKNASFEKEWNDLVLASFDASTTVQPNARKLSNGLTVLSYGAQGVSRSTNQPYYVELNMFDCGNSVQSAMLVSGSKQHLQFFDSSWQSLIAKVKTAGEESMVTTAAFPFTGYWGKSSNSPYGGDITTNAGYYKFHYDFKPNGTYTFHGESWGGYTRSNDYILIDESGSYSIIDKQLVIMPAKGKLQQVDKDGKVKKTEPLDISRRMYTWQLYYFEGINETNLILTSTRDYLQDGGYSANQQFPNSYLLSKDYKPEWKIPVK
jgi:hypothetical protein